MAVVNAHSAWDCMHEYMKQKLHSKVSRAILVFILTKNSCHERMQELKGEHSISRSTRFVSGPVGRFFIQQQSCSEHWSSKDKIVRSTTVFYVCDCTSLDFQEVEELALKRSCHMYVGTFEVAEVKLVVPEDMSGMTDRLPSGLHAVI